VKIPLPGFVPYFRFGDILVDEARDRVYITGGKGTRALVVSDLNGGSLRTIADVAPGDAGMTLSRDGTKLYVAASDSDGITIVDTATYATSWHWTGTNDGTMTCPRDIAFAAAQLWFSWGCDNAPAAIGRVDSRSARAAPSRCRSQPVSAKDAAHRGGRYLHGELRWAAIPARCTRRRSTSRTNSTYSRVRPTVCSNSRHAFT
jgi:hypothetical protein